MIISIIIAIIVVALFIAFCIDLRTGPVAFCKEEVGKIFYVVSIGEDGETAELILQTDTLPLHPKKSYVLPQSFPPLEVGKTYELVQYISEFSMKQIFGYSPQLQKTG